MKQKCSPCRQLCRYQSECMIVEACQHRLRRRRGHCKLMMCLQTWSRLLQTLDVCYGVLSPPRRSEQPRRMSVSNAHENTINESRFVLPSTLIYLASWCTTRWRHSALSATKSSPLHVHDVEISSDDVRLVFLLAFLL